jgi:hypothetical protein
VHILGQVIDWCFDFRVNRMSIGIIGMAQRDDAKLESAQFECPDFLGNEGFG